MGLDGNRLTGKIPSSIANMDKLINLRLENNRLSGPIPPGIGNFEEMVKLNLHNNQLTGPIPDDFRNFEKIRELRPEARSVVSVRAAASRGLPGLRHSVGRLCLVDEELIFVGSRWFRLKALPLPAKASVSWSRGFLFNRLYVRSGEYDISCLVFKDAPAGGSALAELVQATS